VTEGQVDKRLTSTKQHGEISIEFYCIDAVAMPIKDNVGGFELEEFVRQGMTFNRQHIQRYETC
jgi:hypothetical protein